MAVVGGKYPRPCPAHPDWIHRSAYRNAAPGLQLRAAADVHPDADDGVATGGPRRRRRLTIPANGSHCRGGSPLVRFFAKSISVTAIRISARVLRSGASSMACFSGAPKGDIIASALTSASLGAFLIPSQSA